MRILEACGRQNWSQIRPAIFGNIFEAATDKEKRHSYGIHFTSEVDIMKIVRPTISKFWEEKIEAATTIKELNKLQLELQGYRVLDPACGSGNFLYIAYQELKRIEQLLLEKVASRRRSKEEQIEMSFVTPVQFYGMDNNQFAVELARVTLMIARKVAIDKFKLTEPALPLDTSDKNIVCQDALFSRWPEANAIIGNPPFLGGKHIRLAVGDEYVDRVFEQFYDVKDSVDFCCYWYRLAHEYLGENGRAGLVGTNSVSQGKSRVASLDFITQNGGYIHEAISTQPWSGEANVHVSIINWSKQKPEGYYLDNQKVSLINSSLTSTIDVSGAVKLKANKNQCFQGVIPNGKGFIVTEKEVNIWIEADAKNQDVLKLFSMGRNLAQNPHGKPERWIIDFNDMSIEEASYYQKPFERVRETIPKERQNNRNSKLKVNWWKYEGKRLEMRKAIAPLSCYFAVPEVSKWAIFIPCFPSWLPGNTTKVVASEDFYILGILLSQVHRIWIQAKSSTLKGDIRYTHNTCFETFPFPQNPSQKLVQEIRETTKQLHQYRTKQMEEKQWGITQLYNQFFTEPSSQLFKLHAQLDKLVIQAYKFNNNDNILEKILELNLELAAIEKQGK
ncbi:DNA methyltransferase, partial [Hydrocoleum sp. CS-953]